MKDKQSQSHWQPATKLVHGGRLTSEFGETSEALFLNSSYSYETAVLMCQLKSGDHVVASKTLFSSCQYIITQVLPRFGITYTLVECGNNEAWKKAITAQTKCVFIETPANPTLELVDIAEVAKICKSVGAQLIVDNVFSAPLTQRPLELGADVVMYSTTKHIDGQGRTLGGALLGKKAFIEDILRQFCRHTGPHMSHFNAWLILKSLETLELRLARHNENAAKVAEALAGHAKVSRLIYPGHASHPQYALAQKQMSHGGPMLAFEIVGGREAAFRFMNALEIFDISNNLGNAKSIVTHPASTTHYALGAEGLARAGITQSLVRVSAGIEDGGDLVKDVIRALDKA
ncbi:MAG: aminotransferase class I/II-fold pyridoxal phosphate-dependent enzyme [Alphaproteobacteria bacterium]|nr:aminotransferase class I/II-fold pyridoxal phosphate-dependent enzyme [Alphaproteobacteria bacterium]